MSGLLLLLLEAACGLLVLVLDLCLVLDRGEPSSEFRQETIEDRAQALVERLAVRTQQPELLQILHTTPSVEPFAGRETREERPYALKARPVIDRLVRARNGIAHGVGVRVDATDYGILHSEVIGLMDSFRKQISYAAAFRSYRV